MRAWMWLPTLAMAMAGCALFVSDRLEAGPVTWRPFRLAHIAHPEVDDAGGAARLQRAGERLAHDRYLDAVVVGGRLGAPPARIAELLAAAGKPVVVVGPDDALRVAHQPFRGLLLLTLAGAKSEAAAVRARELDPVLRGRWVAVALDGPLTDPGAASAAESELAYSVEALDPIRVLLVPAQADGLSRSAALVVVSTAPLSVGTVRILAVEGQKLRTWTRHVGDGPREVPDGPIVEAVTR